MMWTVVFQRQEFSTKKNSYYVKEEKTFSLTEIKEKLTPRQFYKLDCLGVISTKYGNYYLKRVD